MGLRRSRSCRSKSERSPLQRCHARGSNASYVLERIKAVLSIVGVLVFAFLAFIGLFASLIALLTIGDWRGNQWGISFGIWAATVLLIVVGTRYVIRPRTRGWGVRAALVPPLVLIMLFAHPWIFAIPGILGEAVFVGSLRTGMSADQVHALALKTGGTTNGVSSSLDKLVTVRYVRWSTFCAAGGDVVQINMGGGNHVSAWHTTEWSDGC